MGKREERLIAAANHWETLADQEEAMAKWDSEHGYGDVQVYKRHAETYRRTAKSLRLEAGTGKPHCTNCLGDHPNHECKVYKTK